MKLKLTASLLVLGGLVAAGHTQQLFSFEGASLEGWQANDGTVSGSATGATLGSQSLHWSRPDGWTRIFGDLTADQATALNNATHKRLLVDVTQTDGGAFWRQIYLIFNSESGGWSQSGTPVPIAWALNGTQTAVIPYGDLNIPAAADSYRQMHLVFQSGGAPDPGDVYFDNMRIENSSLINSFEGGVADLSSGGATISSVSDGASDGTMAAQVEWPGGFNWVTLNLTNAQAAAINSSVTKRLLVDVNLPTPFADGGWGNVIVGVNDGEAGWRQGSQNYDLPAFSGGKQTLAFDLSSFGALSTTTFAQVNFGINAGSGSNKVFQIDNIRVEVPVAAGLTGHIDVGTDYSASTAGLPVAYEVRNGATVLSSGTTTMDASGNVSISTTASGAVTVWVKPSHWLAKTVSATVGGSAFSVAVKNGDIDNDNSITVFDYGVLSDYFDKSSADGDWNTVGGNGFAPKDADIDADGAVTVFDYGIISDNFDLSGDA